MATRERPDWQAVMAYVTSIYKHFELTNWVQSHLIKLLFRWPECEFLSTNHTSSCKEEREDCPTPDIERGGTRREGSLVAFVFIFSTSIPTFHRKFSFICASQLVYVRLYRSRFSGASESVLLLLSSRPFFRRFQSIRTFQLLSSSWEASQARILFYSKHPVESRATRTAFDTTRHSRV